MRNCRLGFWLASDLRLTHEGGTFFDGQGSSGYVTEQSGVAFQFTAFQDGDVALNLAKNDHVTGVDFTFDLGVLTDRKSTFRMDFTFDPSVNNEVVGELDGTSDLNVVRQNVF